MSLINVTLNPNDLGGTMSLSNGNLTVTSTAGTNGAVRASHGKTKGKWYWEVKLDNSINAFIIGVSNKNYPITSTVYTGTTGDALYLRGYNLSNGRVMPENGANGTTLALGDVMGVALDLDNGTLEFYKNGISLGVSHSNLGSLGEVFPIFKDINTSSKIVTFNFGNTPFAYPMPTGYLAYANNSITTMSIKNPTTLKHYSLDNKTLIHLPSSSDKNMILHGVESGKEIKLDEDFDKMKYVKDTNEVLGNGKTFTHALDMSNTKINKIIL